jgi:hypothetical protein
MTTLRSIRRRALIGAAALAMLAVLSPSLSPASARLRFGRPVLLTTDPVCGGYEPGLVVDRYNNIVATAHKDNHCLVVAPDPHGPLPVRSQTWLWTSSDGVHFTNMPGLSSLGVDRLDFGDEGDLALDDVGQIYFVDTKVAEISLTRWQASGRGRIDEEFTTPATLTAQPVDDRPWVTAHGNGVVLYFSNEGDKVSGLGGRYSVYVSKDGGQTFPSVGTVLPDSGWCRPAADHRPRSKTVYAICTNDSGANAVNTNEGDPQHVRGTLWSYVSHDDGAHWSRYRIDSYNGRDNNGNTRNINWPISVVDKNGVVYALYIDNFTKGECQACGTPAAMGVTITGNRLLLYRSANGGRTWQKRDVTPKKALYHFSWLDLAPNGTIGVVYYSATKPDKNWYVYAGTAPSFTAPFTFTSIAPKNPVLKGPEADSNSLADLFACAFGPDNLLNVTWEARGVAGGASSQKRWIYFARQIG